MRTCTSCEKNFNPTSNHKDCPSCRYHKSKTTLCSLCSKTYHSPKYDSCRACTNTRRPDYGTGRYKKNGYIMIFQKGHPRTSGKGKNYVFEHIVVMEKYLGRYLKADENVHHKNGVKDDNRITNLELWVRPQPVGIRATEALDWAKEIVARYEPLKQKL